MKCPVGHYSLVLSGRHGVTGAATIGMCVCMYSSLGYAFMSSFFDGFLNVVRNRSLPSSSLSPTSSSLF